MAPKRLHVLRAEKGYIVVGDETDGTTTPHDVGLDPVSFPRRRQTSSASGRWNSPISSRAEPQATRRPSHRETLNDVLPDGAYAVREVKDKPPMEMIGQVTSSYMSPTLGRSIAMALIENGRARMGETISFPLEGGKVMRALITDTVFYDKEGARLNA